MEEKIIINKTTNLLLNVVCTILTQLGEGGLSLWVAPSVSRAFVHFPGYADNALEFLVGSEHVSEGSFCLLAKTLAVASG